MTRAKILIVEDEVILAKEMARGLERSGYEVVGKVTTGEEAVRKAEETRSDLILMDIQLDGEMDGIEASAVIRSRLDAAVIYLTAHTTTDLFERAKITEPYAYLTKPVSPEELGRTVEMALYRHRMESRLKESEAKYRNLFENMSNGVAIFRAVDEGNDFEFVDFNTAAEKIDGIRRDSLMGRTVLEVFPGVKEFGLFDVFRRVWRTGEPEHHPTARYKDERITGWRENFVYRLPSGEIVAVYSDETARKQAEQALSSERERLAVTLGSIGDGVISTDTDGRILSLNKAAEELTGWNEAEAQGKHLEQVFCVVNEQTRQRCDNYVQTVLERGNVGGHAISTVLIARDGTEKIVAHSGTPITDREGEIIGVVLAFRDITEEKRAERLLQESEKRFRLAMEATNDGLWDWDLQSDDVYRSPAFYEMLAYQPEEFPPGFEGWKSLLHPDDVEPVMATVRDYVSGKLTEYEIEFRMLSKSGETKWILSRGKLVDRDKHHKPVRMIGTHTDITERKLAETALQNQLSLMGSMLEAIPAPVYFKNTEHVYLGCNEAFGAFLGLPKEKIIGKSVFDVAPQGFAEVYRAQDEALFENPGSQVYESPVKSSDGTTRDVIFHKATYADSSGRAAGLIGVMVDITKRKRAEDELKESERRLSVLMANLPGMAYRCKNCPNWTMEIISEGCAELTGYSPEDLVGDRTIPYTDLIHPEDRRKVWTQVQEALAEGRSFEIEYRIRTRSGDEKWVWERGVGVRSEKAHEMKLEGFISDITEKRRLQDQLREAQKMEAVGTLAGGVAHDFNNLLQIIGGHAELLELELAQRGMRFSELDAIRHSTDRGADLVQQLLTFSRRMKPKVESINLNDDVMQAERLLYRTIPKMIEIEVKLEKELRPVQADCTQIEQMLINLAVNAKDAMPDGGRLTIETHNVTLDEQQCRTHTQLTPGEHVLLRVSDTGQGMNQDVLEHIFEPFFTTKARPEGTGLGLSTVFGIVRMHGGYITCESEVGKGTTFSIYFPVAGSADRAREGEHEVSGLVGGAETILVVDDEPLIRDLARRILENAGYAVLTAGSGKEAIAVYSQKQSNIALVILDLIMPKMGGKQCLEELLRINPQVKALIASGFAVKGDAKTFLDSEAKGMVSKPFNMRELLRSVRRVIDRI